MITDEELIYDFLFKAEAGSKAVHVSMSSSRSTELYNKAAKIGLELGAKVGINRIEFPGKGYVEFIHLH